MEHRDAMSDTFAPSLSAFLGGYIACLLAPGPNLIVVAGVAIARGARGVLPISSGVAFGSLALSLGLYAAASLLPDTQAILVVGKLVGAVLFLFIGWRMIRSPRASTSNTTQPAEFALGVTTSAFNPITAAYFGSQFLGEIRSMSLAQEAATFIAIGAIAFARCILIGVIFGAFKARLEMRSRGRFVSILIGCMFLAIAARDIVITLSSASLHSTFVWSIVGALI